MSRFVTGFGAISCYLMSWHLVVEILKKDTKVFGDCSGITYFSVMANFLSIAFALGEASSKLRPFLSLKTFSLILCCSCPDCQNLSQV